MVATLLGACGSHHAAVKRALTPVAPGAAAQPLVQTIPAGPGALMADVIHRTAMRASPGGHAVARLSTQTEFGSPEFVWVVAHRPGWLGVVSPLAGNGRLGWISQSATLLSRNTWQLRVSLSARRLTVLHDGRAIQHFTVAIGPPATPTPVGRFAVTDRLVTDDPHGPYGCCILALSAHSPHTIQGWSGGDRIAIHSTPDVASIGLAASHGCVRVTLPEGRWLLHHIPLGTPALITT
jgi:hypothetical protein